MLVPLTRQKFEQIIPLIATGPQYAYYWGKFADFLKRLMISVVAVTVLFFTYKIVGEGFGGLIFFLGIFAGLYWLWGPIYWASIRNAGSRRYLYAGFWRGRVLDIFVSEELIGEEQTVNKRGQLVIIENRERRLNLEVGDDSGFSTALQVPLRRLHKSIRRGQIAEMVVMSNRPDLSSIVKVSDIYIPDLNLWVSDYPYMRRDVFSLVSRKLENTDDEYYPSKQERKPKRRKRQQTDRL
ncbi:phosphate ABC transporter permease [Microcoleus sp. FACHB-831]|uniref:phosphate ABC transporter permease n=1 Tax=Microcoleus sp. FACHB-831 TaxID=2692827 RepID=UPI001683892B|nr:phosphate ABC transporter permease [Microcoleus sp. FACHB-831]MBD1920501.1 phosphate ABC transporter permease [Microcoleus sp. FACHB-831]